MLTLCWILPLTILAAASAGKPLTPEQAMRPNDGAKLTVEFQVLAVGIYTANTLGLDFRAARDDKQDQFVVVLSEKAQAAFKRVGIHDLDRHFRGKRVRVVGKVSREHFTGLNQTGAYHALHVDDLSQFEQVD